MTASCRFCFVALSFVKTRTSSNSPMSLRAIANCSASILQVARLRGRPSFEARIASSLNRYSATPKKTPKALSRPFGQRLCTVIRRDVDVLDRPLGGLFGDQLELDSLELLAANGIEQLGS